MIPIISLRDLRSGSRKALLRIGGDIGRAAREVGFFAVSDHGIETALVGAVFGQAKAFFDLPLEEKERLSATRSSAYRGYVGIGDETLDPARRSDAKECFNAGREFAADDPDVLSGKPFCALNHWPSQQDFREVLLQYRSKALDLVIWLHRAIAVDLGVEALYFDHAFTNPVGLLRLLHYPAQKKVDRTDDNLLAGTHTDYGNLTLLAQDDVGGLEIRRRDGAWIAACPVPGTFICNVGDCLMRWTNDVYVSNPHRVINLSGRERYSVAFFGDCNADTIVKCVPSLIGAGECPKYAPIKVGEYLRSRYADTYRSSVKQ